MTQSILAIDLSKYKGVASAYCGEPSFQPIEAWGHAIGFSQFRYKGTRTDDANPIRAGHRRSAFSCSSNRRGPWLRIRRWHRRTRLGPSPTA